MKKTFFFCAFCLFGSNFLTLGQPTIRFKVPVKKEAVNTQSVLFLAGDFNNWNAADTSWKMDYHDDGFFELTKTLGKGQHAFKLTQGSWDKAECNTNGSPIDNRYLNAEHDTTLILIPAAWQHQFKPQPKKHTASAQVIIINNTFKMPQLGRERRVWIYLPKAYMHSHKKYPVIYMHDGQNLFDNLTSGFGEWGIDELMDKMPDNRQSIIVGIDHGGDNRITEYDPYDSKYGKGRGDDYANFMANTLKPYVDAHYRTIADAKHTTIAGSSMGGLISLYIATKYPGVFGNAGVFSPALWIAPEMFNYVTQQKNYSPVRYYLVCGDAESDTMVSDMKKMADLLKNKVASGSNIPFVVVKGAHHNEQQWHDDFPGFYNWLLKQY